MNNTLPSGTVTFLFTDIEGSTQLWEQHPDVMKLALARHDMLLRRVIEANEGQVFKTMGDAFCAVFASAPNALLAALGAQRALQAEDWGAISIRVRMGLHTGAAEMRDNDYFGPPLNRVARLMSAGHGGQVLLSTATAELVRVSLPVDAELRDMGERGLKDLVRPEHIYQLCVPGLRVAFPPLKTLEAFRTNLPAQLTSFIGREKEISTIKSLIAEHRLTTLTGVGGTGKTRLSLQVAADLLDFFTDGVWFVELAPLADPALIPQTVLTTLGLREDAGRPILETLTRFLHRQKTLLILDNCEHLVEAAAQFVDAILRSCPDVRLLVSSREALSIPGEKSYHVASLSIPNIHLSQSVETITQCEAVRLFVARAYTVSSSFAITEANAPAVAQICARLDGIPLAIELAAARVKMLKAEQIAERLDDRFRLLTGGSRTALPRQQTLRALIDWSYDLLPEAERALLRRLSVFAGGWTLEAAETVCQGPGIDDYDVFDPLAQLVNKSLVVIAAEEISEIRYRLLETVRQYAREKLSEIGEGMTVRDAHLQYFLGFAERAEPEGHGPHVMEWIRRLETEMDNIRAALEWSLKRDTQVGLRLAYALEWFWSESASENDMSDWLAKLLKQDKTQPPTIIHARALGLKGFWDDSTLLVHESLRLCEGLGDQQGLAIGFVFLAVLIYEDDNHKAQEFLYQGLSLAQALGNKPIAIHALQNLGRIVRTDKEYERGGSYFEEALALCRELDNLLGIFYNLTELGRVALRQQDYGLAHRWLDETLAVKNRLGDEGTSVVVVAHLDALGELALRERNYEQARIYYDHGLEIIHKTGVSSWPTAWILANLGYAALRQGNTKAAEKRFSESYQFFKETNRTIGIVYITEGLASLATLKAQYTKAARLFSWADVTREIIRDTRPPFEQVDVDRDLATIRAQLDDAAFAEAQFAGRAMSMDEAIALALESTHDSHLHG